MYCEVAVYVLVARSSDHKPFLMCFNHELEERTKAHRGFKFEAKWQLNSEYGAVVEEVWQKGGVGQLGLQTMQNKLATCQNILTRWSGAKFRNAEKLIKKKDKGVRALAISR